MMKVKNIDCYIVLKRRNMYTNSMKFTIGTVSNSINFSEDMNLIKSSLLYADDIELIGMMEYAVFKYFPKQLFDANTIEEMITKWVPFLNSLDAPGIRELVQQLTDAGDKLKLYAPYLKKKKYRTKEEILAQMKLKKGEKELKAQFDDALSLLLSQPGTIEINDLIRKNVISVYDYGMDGFNIDEMSGGYFANLLNAMRDGTSYPLFDKMSTDLIMNVIDTKIIDIGKLNQETLRHAGVASGILMTLPTLNAASFDEILDLKKENQAALINFRSAIYKFSETIETLPWDKDFKFDCLKLYNTEVAPTIQEINEIMTETSVLKNLGRKVLKDEEFRKAAGWTAAGLTTVITTSSSLSGAFDVMKGIIILMGLAGVSKQIVKGFLKTADLVSQAKQEVKEKQKEAGKNVMYYYYLASKMK